MLLGSHSSGFCGRAFRKPQGQCGPVEVLCCLASPNAFLATFVLFTLEPSLDLLTSLLQIAKELPRLQELTLFGGRTFVSERLQPLADCSSLTRLALDSVIVYVPAPPESAESRHAAASEAGSAGCVTRGRATQTPPPAAAGSSWCLPWIQSLSIGNLGVAEFRAPVATLAPHLTELHNVGAATSSARPNSPLRVFLRICIYGSRLSTDAGLAVQQAIMQRCMLTCVHHG